MIQDSIHTSGNRVNESRRRRPSYRAVIVCLTGIAMALLGSAAVAPAAVADTAPDPGTPATVSADALPTWQLNGVVWSQVVVGNTVYATGSFTQARPPGVAVGGAGSIAANNVFAYDITTGAPVANFSHSLNAQGLVVKASPDGSRVYVGGDFTTVDGASRNHIVAFNTATGAVDTSFAASIASQVRGIAVSATTVYAGGNFFSANSKSRTRLAAFSRANGSLLPWAPTADDGVVWTMVLAPDGSRVIAGGGFTNLNGSPANGIGAVDASSGALLPFAANQVIRNGGAKSAILGLTTDGTNVYGSAYAYGTGNFEGTFAVNPTTGDIVFANDCHGDTYDTFPVNGALYSVTHAHDCRWIGSFPQTDADWSINMRHALAFSTAPTGTGIGPDNYGWNFNGYGVSSLLQWFPDVAIGSFTGQYQAAWSVSGNSKYVVLGGEFPRVNGTAQQSLVRFATSDIAPDKRGPVRAPNAPAPSALSFAAGTARVSWQASYDMDNTTLTYDVYRSGTAAPVYSTTQKSNYWTYPMMGFVDKSVVAGSKYTYTVKVTDPFGNILWLPATNQVTIGAGTTSTYEKDVVQDGASAFWRLGEASGATVYDHAGFNDATASAGVTRGTDGAIQGDSDGASSFSGGSDGIVVSPAMSTTSSFSTEAWFKTTTTAGGKIIGYGDATSGTSSSYDRHVYMDNSGRLIFGVYPGGVRTVQTSKAYNDGVWHQMVASQSSAGIALYVDGKKVGSDSGVTSAQPYAGYWRIGGDNLNGWPSQPSSSFFQGSIDDVAVYPTALSLAQIQKHVTDSGRALDVPVAPSDTYGKAIFNDGPDLYWRLGEAGGTSAKDSGPSAFDGTYAGGYTLGQAAGVSGTSNTSVKFDGSSGTVASQQSVSNPTTYSEELWFNTTTNRGGKLIGFGNTQSGTSSNYDRHVYMEDSGQLTFGVWTGATNTITSPDDYNDGTWHFLVANQSSDGMKLYVDGQLVGTNPQGASQDYSGYWRVGGDTTWGGSSNFFDGKIDEVAVYSRALDASTVASHFLAGGGQLPNQSPTAAFTSSKAKLKLTVNGATSHDPDGSVASYKWDWGDGSPVESGTSAQADHTYANAGTFTVMLTVTDDDGASGSVSHDASVEANTSPTAAFESSHDDLRADVDGSSSADSDGSVASYKWDWGDGSPVESGTSAQAHHTYANAGTFTVMLTVTDDDGASASVSHDVTVEHVNKLPTASFAITSTNGLTVGVDGSGSTDPDGSIASYKWNWGDVSGDATGNPASHTYGTDNTYTITLTVTDNEGGAATQTKSVAVSSAPVPFAQDSFTRTVANGWGSADVGGAWTRVGNAANFAVTGGQGSLKMASAGSGTSVTNTSVSSTNADMSVSIGIDKVATGGGVYAMAQPRLVSGSDGYLAEAKYLSGGSVQLILVKTVGGTDTVLTATTVSGLSVVPGDRIMMRAQVFGTSPTTIRAKVWKSGSTEPTAWTSSVGDASPTLQASGGISLKTYLSGSATNAPVTATFDDLWAGPLRPGLI